MNVAPTALLRIALRLAVEMPAGKPPAVQDPNPWFTTVRPKK